MDFEVSLGFVEKVIHLRLNRRRAFAGAICLLAVILMQAPLVLATWSITSGTCCTAGSFCPIAVHHHQKADAAPVHDMNCGHAMGGMSNCAMSCCHDTDQPTIAANLFTMPPQLTYSVETEIVAAVEAGKPTESVRSTEPLSPPPRNTSSTL